MRELRAPFTFTPVNPAHAPFPGTFRARIPRMSELTLHCHPATPCTWISAVTARVDWLSDDLLVFYYRIEGDLDELQLPPQQRSAHRDELWKRTCFEAFIRPHGATSYLEFNFSPSSEWAIYRFEDYRSGMRAVEPARPPKIICRRHERELVADVDVHLGALGIPVSGDLQLALAAVLQDQKGAPCYWAVAHAEGKPDFHHTAGFAATLPRP